jgi:hypothetical protein
VPAAAAAAATQASKLLRIGGPTAVQVLPTATVLAAACSETAPGLAAHVTAQVLCVAARETDVAVVVPPPSSRLLWAGLREALGHLSSDETVAILTRLTEAVSSCAAAPHTSSVSLVPSLLAIVTPDASASLRLASLCLCAELVQRAPAHEPVYVGEAVGGVAAVAGEGEVFRSAAATALEARATVPALLRLARGLYERVHCRDIGTIHPCQPVLWI